MDYSKCFSLFNTSYMDKEIPKSVLLNNIKNKDDKEIVERFVDYVSLKYCIKADSINKSAEENFSEIEIIEISVNNYRAIYDIYGVLLTVIPYPILAIFKYDERISFALSNRVLNDEKNNKGKIFISYLMKKEEIYKYLTVDIDSYQSLNEIYKKWISNIEYVIAYYEKFDKIMQIIEKVLHINNENILEELEGYIKRNCGTYNIKPKDGWKSKLEKYLDSPLFIQKVETHILWEYLSKNQYLHNILLDFSSWEDFKDKCSFYLFYYSQYNRMSEDDDLSYINDNMYKNDKSEYNDTNIKANIKANYKKNGKKSKTTVEDPTSATNNIVAELNNNKDFLLNAIKKNSLCFAFAGDELKNDKDFILKVLEIDCNLLIFVNEELTNDADFMLQAIRKNISCLTYVSDGLKYNGNFMKKVLHLLQ